MKSATKWAECGSFKSSSTSRTYKAKMDPEGNLSCDCPAWRFKRDGSERSCKHVEHIGLTVGDMWFVDLSDEHMRRTCLLAYKLYVDGFILKGCFDGRREVTLVQVVVALNRTQPDTFQNLLSAVRVNGS